MKTTSPAAHGIGCPPAGPQKKARGANESLRGLLCRCIARRLCRSRRKFQSAERLSCLAPRCQAAPWPLGDTLQKLRRCPIRNAACIEHCSIARRTPCGDGTSSKIRVEIDAQAPRRIPELCSTSMVHSTSDRSIIVPSGSGFRRPCEAASLRHGAFRRSRKRQVPGHDSRQRDRDLLKIRVARDPFAHPPALRKDAHRAHAARYP